MLPINLSWRTILSYHTQKIGDNVFTGVKQDGIDGIQPVGRYGEHFAQIFSHIFSLGF